MKRTVHTFNSGVEHKGVAVDVETTVHIDEPFAELWAAWRFTPHPAKLTSEVVAFVCRAGGPPNNRSLRVNLHNDPRLTKRPFRGDHYRGTVNVWVSPYEGIPGWEEFRHYAGKPLLPAYRVRNPKEALVACVAHETSHWLGIGRHPSEYWRNEQALDGTEFVCEIMGAVALEVFCFPQNRRFREL